MKTIEDRIRERLDSYQAELDHIEKTTDTLVDEILGDIIREQVQAFRNGLEIVLNPDWVDQIFQGYDF